ncbi:response regulator [Sphingomonas soli]|uniref:response regulator n=1 Tax=Sphingomonas soli TaxID=266127 RepID=UPI000831E61C|nr:response regulator [Sphingomonas soli]
MNTRVLIVDDSFTVRMNLKEAFEEANLTVKACSTLGEAREVLSREEFGLIVLDVRLPDGDGVEFLAEIKAAPGTNAVAVMLLSSETEVQDRLRGLRTGADEYVGKPYDLSYVVARAGELLRRAQTDETLVGQTILVIDDSPTYREQLKQALEDAAYHVLTASSGEDGLRLAAAARPTAMVVDGVLPDIDGPSVIRRVRLDAALRRIPCILLTASTDLAAEVRALDAGADAFVRKSDEIEILLARLGAVLRSAERLDAGELASPSLLGPKKILAVDDSETYLQHLASELRAEGYDVALARSGEEALELLVEQPVDCILLDLMMPGMDGHDTCRQIKSVPLLRGTPVIMLTAMEDRESMVRGLDAGADDYICKSSDFDILRSRVLAQLRRKQFEDQARLIREQLAQKELEAVEARAARELDAMQAVLVERRRNEIAVSQLQSELAHVSRWNAMGMMAATLAHELNQPLTAGMNFLEVARRRLNVEDMDHAAAEMVENASRQLARAGDIIRNLRDFIEKRETNRTVEDLNKVVEEAIALGTVGTAYSSTRLEVDLAPGLPPMLLNKVQIQQVIVNLCRNAMEAMRRSQQRVLTIATRLDDRRSALISVSDTGPGIDGEVMKRLFQPFTTTKSDGMGIGLKICQSIIEAHAGRIWISPNDQAGVTFNFTLPTEMLEASG